MDFEIKISSWYLAGEIGGGRGDKPM